MTDAHVGFLALQSKHICMRGPPSEPEFAHTHTDDNHTEREKVRSIPNPQSNRSPVQSNRIHSTLLSDLARSLRKTAFLSAKASVAAMAPTHTSNEPDRIGPSPDWNLLPRARSMGGPIDRRGRERGRGVAGWKEMEGKGWRRGGRGKNGRGGRCCPCPVLRLCLCVRLLYSSMGKGS